MGALSDAFQTKSGARLELANAMSVIAAAIGLCTRLSRLFYDDLRAHLSAQRILRHRSRWKVYRLGWLVRC